MLHGCGFEMRAGLHRLLHAQKLAARGNCGKLFNPAKAKRC